MYGASWSPAGAERFGLYEGNAAPAPAAAVSSLGSLSTPSPAGARESRSLSLENPLTVYVGLAALTFGLMAFSTSGTVRVGKTKLTAGVGVGSTS